MLAFKNLHYDDDMLIFYNYNIKLAIILKWILRYFKSRLGLRINFSQEFYDPSRKCKSHPSYYGM